MRRLTMICCGLLVVIAGCKFGINEDIIRLQAMPGFEKYGEIRKVAVIPFGNYWVTRGEKVLMGVPHSIGEDNGKIICDIFSEELIKRVPYKVVGPEKVAEFFRKRNKSLSKKEKKDEPWGILTSQEIQRVGELLKVDALLMGQVENFSAYKYRMHKNSLIGLSVKMTETVTGEPVFTGSIKMDQEGRPHVVARRGVKLLLDQLVSRTQSQEKKDDSFKSILNR